MKCISSTLSERNRSEDCGESWTQALARIGGDLTTEKFPQILDLATEKFSPNMGIYRCFLSSRKTKYFTRSRKTKYFTKYFKYNDHHYTYANLLVFKRKIYEEKGVLSVICDVF